MFDSLFRIIALSRLIVIDGFRRQALIGLILFALAVTFGGLIFLDFIPRDTGRATNDFLFSVNWLAGFIFLLFHALQVMAWDSERGSLHNYLARPISRTEYGLAIFAGLASLLLVLNVILCAMSWVVLTIVKGSLAAAYFPYFSLPFFMIAGLGIYWNQLMILSVVFLFSSMVRGSFPVLLLTLCYYLISNGLPVVRLSLRHKEIIGYPDFIDSAFKWLTAIFPDFSWFDFKSLVVTNDPSLVWFQLLLPFGLALLYIVIFLWLACGIYNRRDLH